MPLFCRASVFVVALAWAALTIGSLTAPAPASATDGPYYRAELTVPVARDRMVAGGVAWTCQGTVCAGNRGTSRPLRVCRGLAREVGALTSFSAAGAALPADELAKCNGD